LSAAETLVIGVGNEHAGDDAAGRLVARALARLGCACDVTECTGLMTDLVPLMEERKAVVIIDACRSGAPIGTVHWLDVAGAPVPSGLRTVSSHGLGVAEAVELARSLAVLPPSCILVALEGQSFGLGAPVSGGVLEAAGVAAERIAAWITRAGGRTDDRPSPI
jgi:hydrogenase maturation protease